MGVEGSEMSKLMVASIRGIVHLPEMAVFYFTDLLNVVFRYSLDQVLL
jgi:hypothetical protein